MKKNSVFFILSFLIFIGCSPTKKELAYKGEAIGTIKGYTNSGTSNGLVVTLLSGSSINTNNSSYCYYTYEVNGKKYGGETSDGFVTGEKFLIKYDPAKLDNDHNYLVCEQPVFLADDKVTPTTGTIKTVYGKNGRKDNRITFQYCISVENPQLDSLKSTLGKQLTFEYYKNSSMKDSLVVRFTKLQYLPPTTNVEDLKKNLNKKYKVLYSTDNLQRAILYVND